LPAAQTKDKNAVNPEQMRKLCEELREEFDYTLIDCPAGIDLGFHRSVVCADEAIIVTTPHMPSIRDSDKVVKILNSYDLNSVYSVVNRVRGDLVADGEMIDAHEVFEILNIKPLGIIPEDDMINCGRSGGGKGCRNAYDIIAQNLANNTSVMYDCIARYSGFLGRIRRNLKKNA
jgi:septum site-determining protein MinD